MNPFRTHLQKMKVPVAYCHVLLEKFGTLTAEISDNVGLLRERTLQTNGQMLCDLAFIQDR